MNKNINNIFIGFVLNIKNMVFYVKELDDQKNEDI